MPVQANGAGNTTLIKEMTWLKAKASLNPEEPGQGTLARTHIRK